MTCVRTRLSQYNCLNKLSVSATILPPLEGGRGEEASYEGKTHFDSLKLKCVF